MATIGERIIKLRNELDLNQKELAKKAGITEASLSRYENNIREPKGEIIAKIAESLGCSTDYLLGRTDSKKDYTNMEENSIYEITPFKNYKTVEQKIRKRLINEKILLDDESITQDMLDKFFKYGMEATIEILKLKKKLDE